MPRSWRSVRIASRSDWRPAMPIFSIFAGRRIPIAVSSPALGVQVAEDRGKDLGAPVGDAPTALGGLGRGALAVGPDLLGFGRTRRAGRLELALSFPVRLLAGGVDDRFGLLPEPLERRGGVGPGLLDPLRPALLLHLDPLQGLDRRVGASGRLRWFAHLTVLPRRCAAPGRGPSG